MKFSMSLPVLRDPGHAQPYHRTFALARIAEEAGFDTATIGHHHFMPGNMSDPLTLLAAVAARTDTLRVGTGIFQLPVHNPLRVAEQVATIDEISGGRVSLGVGLGWWPLEYQAHGSEFRTRGARMEEALQILRLVWSRENVQYQGRFHSFPELTVHPRPVQEHIPLWVAGVADTAVERAARLGDAWLCGPVQSLAKAQACLAVYRAACAAHDKRPDWVLRRYAWVGKDRRSVAEEVLPAYVDGLLAHWRESAEDDTEKDLFRRLDAGEDVPAEEIAHDRLLWGAPEDVVAQVGRYRESTGCDHVHAAFGAGLPAGDSAVSTRGSYDELAEMIRLFGREVIPAFG
ncbi:LLM class flavin-dependent oxidoreductase [Embleya sp. NBC_00896]|uniref:LLM class flavin-dependent oxidoreductase n=1 Tax=Embleya sp. NBC_00896 TaxID=2975961 RepID=UPI002F91A2B3|nr:LLM class flavin-dependent oxidoreductase [Embleya sp. NBC_00896]